MAISRDLPEEAIAVLDPAERELRRLGARWILAVALNTHGRAALVAGDHIAAAVPLRESAEILGGLRDRWAVRFALTHLADAAALAGDPRRAALLYGAADFLSERNVSSFPVNQALSQRCRDLARSGIGVPAFDALHAQGRALPFAEATALAAEG